MIYGLGFTTSSLGSKTIALKRRIIVEWPLRLIKENKKSHSLLSGWFLTNNNIRKEQATMEKKKKTQAKQHEGEIYLVSPRHVVDKKDIDTYNKLKGDKAKNKRLVMVGVEKSGKKVQLSNMTTKATKKQVDKKWKVPLKNTFNNPSYVETTTISKSKSTKKPFILGKPPLANNKGMVHNDDLKRYKSAREQRYKKKPPK
ncbi:MAG: hypothetical protein U1C51_01790 [Candidatus Izemoplasmatales bacterium]|nr:hypothetical protein [Candidatus Izemoplasmatales bacterium]